MQLHSINAEQSLYVLHAGEGFSCYGFEVLDRKARAVAAWCGAPAPTAPPGTSEHFAQCAAAMDAGRAHHAATGRRCLADIPPELAGLIGRRVEVTHPDGTRERFKVGRSTGWMPCALALHNNRSTGGPAAYFPVGSTVRVIA